jgi:hypothetical protein
MTGIFDNATFGSVFKTNDGDLAVYLCYIPYSDLHKLFVRGFEHPFLYHGDGKRRGGGKYAVKYGTGLDIDKKQD